MAHSLVPPTPGPLFVAGALNVDLGVMILAGCVVCIFTSLVGYAFAVWSNRRMEIPLRDVPDTPTDRAVEDEAEQEKKLPPLWLALLPVVLPVILIAGSTILNATLGKMDNPSDGVKSLLSWMKTLGNKNIALTIAAGIGLLTLATEKDDERGSPCRSQSGSRRCGYHHSDHFSGRCLWCRAATDQHQCRYRELF